MTRVRIVEVGPRDGLQNIAITVPTGVKVELIRRLARSNLRSIEATSFVSPKAVPQLADGTHVLDQIQDLRNSEPGSDNIRFPVLVPNVQGLISAHQAGVKEVAVFVSATEGFSQANTRCSVAESLVRVQKVAKMAKDMGIALRGYVSCIFSDPYDGPTNPSQVIKVTQVLLDAGCYEVSLGDTLGVGTPFDVENLLSKMLKTITADRLAGHFHDTYGQAIANVVKALDMGIRTFDSSVAGLGGCPFAKGARGNLSTEDLVYTLEKMGIQTGVNLDELVSTGAWISEQLQLPNGSRAGSALFAKSKASTAVEIRSTKSTRPWTTLKSAGDYRLSRRGANVNICLTRPQNGNALSLPMIRSLIALFKRFSADESVFRIILSAEGKYFCTGMDLKGPGTGKERFDGLSELYHVIDTCPKTTIAAIGGPCLGGGVGLVFVCDIRLLASTVTFKLSEVRLGLCPATISKYIVREWGFAFARAAMLTAREVTASELAILNIVHKVSANKEALLLDLDNFLDEMRFVAPHASRLSKGLVTSAWLYAGGMEQEQVIERSFSEMMAKGTESEHAIKEFRKGVKGVDWELLSTTAVRPKL